MLSLSSYIIIGTFCDKDIKKNNKSRFIIANPDLLYYFDIYTLTYSASGLKPLPKMSVLETTFKNAFGSTSFKAACNLTSSGRVNVT